jgi:hypothetical protein
MSLYQQLLQPGLLIFSRGRNRGITGQRLPPSSRPHHYATGPHYSPMSSRRRLMSEELLYAQVIRSANLDGSFALICPI